VDAGTMMPDGVAADTVTAAVAVPKLGVVAVMLVEPAATAVTGTFAVVVFAAIVTVAGTVAAFALLDARLTVTAAGGVDPLKFNTRVPALPAMRERLVGVKKLVPPLVITCTCVLAGV
jgi:hypothetical protein